METQAPAAQMANPLTMIAIVSDDEGQLFNKTKTLADMTRPARTVRQLMDRKSRAFTLSSAGTHAFHSTIFSRPVKVIAAVAPYTPATKAPTIIAGTRIETIIAANATNRPCLCRVIYIELA